jgi:hypothetical protein
MKQEGERPPAKEKNAQNFKGPYFKTLSALFS